MDPITCLGLVQRNPVYHRSGDIDCVLAARRGRVDRVAAGGTGCILLA